MVPVDTSAAEPIIDMATEAKNSAGFRQSQSFCRRETRRYSGRSLLCGFESIDAGIFQAEYLVKLLGTEKPVGYAILVGMLSNEAAVARTEGNKQVLSKYPNYKLLLKRTVTGNVIKG